MYSFLFLWAPVENCSFLCVCYFSLSPLVAIWYIPTRFGLLDSVQKNVLFFIFWGFGLFSFFSLLLTGRVTSLDYIIKDLTYYSNNSKIRQCYFSLSLSLVRPFFFSFLYYLDQLLPYYIFWMSFVIIVKKKHKQKHQ